MPIKHKMDKKLKVLIEYTVDITELAEDCLSDALETLRGYGEAEIVDIIIIEDGKEKHSDEY